MNSYQWQGTPSRLTKLAGVYDVDLVTTLTLQVEAMSKKIDRLSTVTKQTQLMHCDLCGGGHGNHKCLVIGAMENADEQAHYLGNAYHPQNNPYNNMYNSWWRNHLNFSCRNQGQQRQNSLPRYQ